MATPLGFSSDAGEKKTADLSTTLRSGRDDKFVVQLASRILRNKFVISTGAKRSGEICGSAESS
jgi:hypothetical protein